MTNSSSTCFADSGMTIKQYIVENNTDYLVIKHKVENQSDEEEYRKYFDKLKEEGTLINDAYDDQIWIGFIDNDTATTTLKFTFEVRPKINTAVKNYILVKLYIQKCSFETAKARLLHIKHFMTETAFMNADNVKDYQNRLCTWSGVKKREAISIREFLIFSNLENAELYYDILKDIRKEENNFRKLPNIQGIMVFDYIVNDYWNNIQYSDNRYRLFPIILWWKITTAIPTRPIEFFNLKRDCAYEKNGKFYFKLERQKTILDKELIISDIVTDFEINEELYSLIHDYVEYCNQIDDCKYLISPPTCDAIYDNRIYNKRQKFTNQKLTRFYKVFLKEVVEDMYHYKVVKSHDTKEGELPYIFFGDTRHLAIMNMMLQGVNPVYIAQLAGHHSLNIQMGYYAHLETFTTAKTYMLKQLMTKNSQIRKNNFEEDARNTSSIIKRELLGIDYYSLPKVANGQGRCSSENVPYNCNHKSCLFCKYFMQENVKEEYIEHFKEENSRDIELIKRELKELVEQVSLRDDIALQQGALKLGVLLNQKIIIDSYKYEKGDKD